MLAHNKQVMDIQELQSHLQQNRKDPWLRYL